MMQSIRSCLIFLAVGVLGGCAVGPDYVSPKMGESAAYGSSNLTDKNIEADGNVQKIISGSLPVSNWWNYFGSDELDAAINFALKNNASLKAAEASLSQSQNLLRSGYGIFLPHIGVNASASRLLNSPNQQDQKISGSVFNLTTLSAGVTYSLDLFGGQRRYVEALRAGVDFQQQQARATMLMLTSNLVNTSLARVAYSEELEINKNIQSLQGKQLKVLDAQVNGGVSEYAKELVIQSLQHQTEITSSLLLQQMNGTDHLMAVLEGVDPAQVVIPKFSIENLTLPKELPVSLPSNLIKQRPDILSAEAELHLASANIGVATANMFPYITLGANYGDAANAFANLPADAQKYWSSGVSVSVPIFQGGSLFFARQAAKDAYQQSLANYRQVVLTAFAQVADCMSALENDTQILGAQKELLNVAVVNLGLTQANFSSGLVDDSVLLASKIEVEQAKIAYIQALTKRYQDTVALYVAVGGGWWNDL